MECDIEILDGKMAVLHLSGRLDLLSADKLKAALADLVATSHPFEIVELASISFIDSSGLGALVVGLKGARAAGGDLRIAGANNQARMVLELTNLNSVLRPYDSVAEAVASW